MPSCHFADEVANGHVLLPNMLPPDTSLYDLSMNEIWALPGHPCIIVKGWDSCTATGR